MNSRQREVSVAMEMHSRNSQPAALVQVLYTCTCICVHAYLLTCRGEPGDKAMRNLHVHCMFAPYGWYAFVYTVTCKRVCMCLRLCRLCVSVGF